MQRVVATSAVAASVDVLRDEILRRADGEWLGSEDDLIESLGVSRPTLRQAARLLEAEELLVVRRGLKGGLFTRRPSTDAVARMASAYLRTEQTTVVDLARSWFLLLEQSAKLAAEHPDPAARAALVGEIAHIERSIASDDPLSRLGGLQAFSLELADLANSPTLRLFTRVLSTLISQAPTDVQTLDGPVQLAGTSATNLARIAAAIRDGNGAAAARHVRTSGELLVSWLVERMPDRTI